MTWSRRDTQMPAAGDAFGQQTKWRRAREGGGRRTDRGSPTWNATRPRGSEGRRQGRRGGRRDGTKGEGCNAVASAGGADRDAAARRRTRAGGRGGRYLNYRPARTIFHLPSVHGFCGSLDLEAAATIGSDGLMTSFAWAMRRPS